MKSTSLGSVCHIEMGQAPKGASYNRGGEGYPLLAGAGDFGVDVPEPTKFTTAPTKLSEPNDILLCIRATIGDLNWSDRKYCLGRGVAGLRPKNGELDRNYLWRWLGFARADLQKRARGSTFKQVSRSDIADLEIVFPETIEEQQRIAAILDKADGIRRKREQALAIADDFLASLFWESFLGPTSDWPMKPLRAVSDLINGDRSKNYPNGKDIVSEGILFLNTKNISRSKIVLAEEAFITEEKFESLARGKLKRGDLVITLRGSIGQCAIFDCEHETGFINAQLMIIRPKAGVTSSYLHRLIIHPKNSTPFIAH